MEKQNILLESGTNEVELLTFIMEDQAFGINVAKVQSIIKNHNIVISDMPGSHHAMIGMMLYRDKTIPLIDLATILDMTASENEDKHKIIVTEFNQSVNSFRVDGVNRIFRVNWNDFVPIDTLLVDSCSSVTGSVTINDTEVMILDMEKILEEIFPSLVLEEITDETLEKAESHKREDVRVVFAEDSKSIRTSVIRVLNNAGYNQITPFASGLPAYQYLMEIIEQGGGKENLPDIIISDIEMPQMDGLTFCRKIKEHQELGKIPVIMFSSLINAQMIEKCKSVKADSYVTKPQTNKLVELLDEYCLKG